MRSRLPACAKGDLDADGEACDATVRLTIRRFEASGLTWPLRDNVTDTVLGARLYASQSPIEFRTLSLLLVFVLVQASEEITNQGCDLVSRFIQCEVSHSSVHVSGS